MYIWDKQRHDILSSLGKMSPLLTPKYLVAFAMDPTHLATMIKRSSKKVPTSSNRGL